MLKTAFILTAFFFFAGMDSEIACANEPTPCACPQWQWATWSDPYGNVYYSYYTKLCDGVNPPFWVNFDTAVDFGAFPGGDCNNESGCSAPSIPALRRNAEVKEPGKEKMAASKHAIEKSEANRAGLGERGLGKGASSGAPMPRRIIPRLAIDGGVKIATESAKFLKVFVRDKNNSEKVIYVKVFQVELDPKDNTSPLFNHLSGETAITFGSGFEVMAEDGSFAKEINWDAVETVNPKKNGNSPFTSCIRFTYENESYQVITSEKIQMK